MGEIDSLDKLDYNNKDHVEIWYNSTKQMNKILLLISKLMLLLITSILTSQIALVLFLTIVPRAYGIDSCVNIYCMYLSFGFTEKVWKNFFCGNKCVQCSFPFIKMWAFTESICCKKKETTETTDGSQRSECQCSIYNEEQRWMHS